MTPREHLEGIVRIVRIMQECSKKPGGCLPLVQTSLDDKHIVMFLRRIDDAEAALQALDKAPS